ncbi:uncharacterized protein [Watersipora subatra]|uniref:uncharacterized protein n=1 Tax=Watersipora subatra TaxID=2589382 RepID=UPI00355BBE91
METNGDIGMDNGCELNQQLHEFTSTIRGVGTIHPRFSSPLFYHSCAVASIYSEKEIKVKLFLVPTVIYNPYTDECESHLPNENILPINQRGHMTGSIAVSLVKSDIGQFNWTSASSVLRTTRKSNESSTRAAGDKCTSTTILENWYEENFTAPYPTSSELSYLVKATGWPAKKISKWLCNRRYRDKNTRHLGNVVAIRQQQKFEAKKLVD